MAYEARDDLEHLRGCFDGWDAEVIQLGRSSSEASTSVTVLPSVRVVRVRAGRTVVIRGISSPKGCAILSSSHDPPVRLLGQPMDASRFAVIGKGARIDIFLPGDAMLCIIVAGLRPGIAPKCVRFHVGTPECVSRLVRCAESAADDPASIDGILIRQVRDAMEVPTVAAPAARARDLRASAAVRACRFIDSRLGRRISLADLCRHCRVSARTLEYGFRQLYDTTPISFIKNQRLSRTHEALVRLSGQSVSIRQIATHLGFTHMGQFSQDYRLLFDETPSMTLRRARERRDADRSASGARRHGE